MSKLKLALAALKVAAPRLRNALRRWMNKRRRRRIAKKLLALVVACGLCGGCKTIDWLEWVDEKLPENDSTPPIVQTEEPAQQEWRTDVATIKPTDGAVEVTTLDITRPTSRNRDGGHEWIIARINTNKGRILVMAMSGDRPPARIYSEAGGPRIRNSSFPVPLMGEHKWRFEQRGGNIAVLLDGEVIDNRSGVQLQSVTMNGYHKRESTGKWHQ